ncbi:MAG: hypothetical protein NTV01_16295 [Bacteroidia bacterium]|nr:hypothetical protein [Bacteroidia bacterium]
MKISGFSYIRNGFNYGYPFLQSIQSVLPVCDEFVIAVGDSADGTKDAIINIGNPKIKIIDTIWDESLRTNGKIFAQQANIALKQITGDWAFHIQADEVIHENDLDKIHEHLNKVKDDESIEGLLFDFLNFYGSYKYLNNSRYQHRKEIRIFRNNQNVFSYKDSQGFRRFPSYSDYLNNHTGYKLKVKAIHIPVYHYNYVRNPKQMEIKMKFFDKFWHDDKYIEKKYESLQNFDYSNIERVKLFEGAHPLLMKEIIENEDWHFDPDKINKQLNIKDKLVYWIEDRINRRIGENKNYIIVR